MNDKESNQVQPPKKPLALTKEVGPKRKNTQVYGNMGFLAGSVLAGFCVSAFVIGAFWSQRHNVQVAEEPVSLSQTQENQPKIQIAVALDSSSSMDGLIEQTRVAIWDIVNTFSETKIDGKTARLELALIEYGNDSISRSDEYVRVLTSFGESLDVFSDKLFEVSTYGGEEYPGVVIERALNELNWSSNKKDYKAIVIAGNEDFNHGPVDPLKAIAVAKDRGVHVNTIFCGAEVFGKTYGWTEAAAKGAGTYLAINHNNVRRQITTRYDDELLRLGERLNNTYIGYGAKGGSGMQMQVKQDRAAHALGKGTVVDRMVSKSKSSYNNASWDLVDAAKSGVIVEELPLEDLPADFQGLPKKELKKAVKNKEKERRSIKQKIKELESKRKKVMTEKTEEDSVKSFDSALEKSVKSQLHSLGFETE